MDCKSFKEWFDSTSIADRDIPENVIVHIAACESCSLAFDEKGEFSKVFRNYSTPEQSADFWDTYLAEVVERTTVKQNYIPIFPFWKKATAPVIAFSLLLAVFVSDGEFYSEDVYSSSLEFLLDQHDEVASEYMLDNSDLFELNEIIPANLGKN